MWPPWDPSLDQFWKGFWVNIFTVPTTVGLAILGFAVKSRIERRHSRSATRLRQHSFAVALLNELTLNQSWVRSVQKFLDETPKRLVDRGYQCDVWRSIQAEMVSLGLPLMDTLPAITMAYVLYDSVYTKALALDNLVMEYHLGRKGKKIDAVGDQLVSDLRIRVNAAEQQGDIASRSLIEYADTLRPG